jgi:plasmid stability protein
MPAESTPMAQLIVREIDDDTRERLTARAVRNGRSLEAEARAILEVAASEEARSFLRNDERDFGDLMYERFKDTGLTDDELRRFNIGIAAINSMSAMRIPDFETEDYEPNSST